MKLSLELKKVYTKEYFILLGIGFFPLIWKILEIVLLAGFDNALKVLGQLSLISIIFKVFEEAILNPLYKMLGKNNFACEEEKNYIAKKFLIWYILATIIFTFVIYLLNAPIMQASQVPDYIFDETINFLKIYIIACGLAVVSKYLYTFSIINKDTKKMFLYLVIKAVATIVLFVIFVPKFALGFGTNGIAIAELIVNLLTILYLIFTFPKTAKLDTKLDKKQYFKLLFFAFAETLIRNVVYYCVILVMLNTLDNQDLYFIANDYIWSIMLVPTLAQNTLVKQALANNENCSLKPYFLNCMLLIAFMLILIPLSLVIFKNVYALTKYMNYFVVLIKLFPCYIIFVIDSVVEAYFFATGKLHHILIQNILTNIFVYLTAFILFICKVWVVSLDSILLLFNLGVIVSSVYTITAYLVNKKQQR